MTAATNYLENALLNGVLDGTQYTVPAAVYLGLYTSDPTETGVAGTEVSGGAYARTALSFAASSAGSSVTDVDCTFVEASADWGTVSHITVCDATSGGNVLFYGALSASKTVNSGDVFKVTAGQLTITLD